MPPSRKLSPRFNMISPTLEVPVGETSRNLNQRSGQYVKWFSEIGIEDVPVVGGKNASLGEMYRELTGKGVKVPNGFAITADAYRHFLRESAIDQEIAKILRDLDTRRIEDLHGRAVLVRQAI